MKVIIELDPGEMTDDVIKLIDEKKARRRNTISRFIADNYAAGDLTSDDVAYLRERLSEIGVDLES